MLEVRGFKKPDELIHVLAATGCTEPAPVSVEETKDDKKTFGEKFRAATLKYSGYSYIFGDSAFMFYAGRELHQHYKDSKAAAAAHAALGATGYASKSPEQQTAILNTLKRDHRIVEKLAGETTNTARIFEKIEHLPELYKGSITSGKWKIVSGLGYGVGSVILAVFGSKDQSHMQIKNSIKQIDRFIMSEGLRDPNSGSILTQEADKKDRNLFERGHDLLSRYPSEALNVVYTGVGLSLMGSSFKQIEKLNHEIKSIKGIAGTEKELKNLKQEHVTEVIDVGLGAITATSALAGILIKEKKSLEGEKKRGGIAGVWDWIQEKPLRATGYGFMAATGVHAVATGLKWKPLDAELAGELKSRRITLGGRGVFIGINVLAETLMAFSSKGHGEGVKNKDIDNTVIASTAEFVSKQNPVTQETLIQRLSGYMASPDVLGGKADEIAASLRAQVSALRENPWAHIPKTHEPVMPETSQETAAPTVSSLAPSTKIQSAQLLGTATSNNLAAAI